MAVKTGTEGMGGSVNRQDNIAAAGGSGCGCGVEDLGGFYGKRGLADSNLVYFDVPTVAGDGVPLNRIRKGEGYEYH